MGQQKEALEDEKEEEKVEESDEAEEGGSESDDSDSEDDFNKEAIDPNAELDIKRDWFPLVEVEDLQAIFFNLAGSKLTWERNRAKLYEIHRSFQSFTGMKYAPKESIQDYIQLDFPIETKQVPSQTIKATKEEQGKKGDENRKRKLLQMLDEEDTEDDTDDEVDEDDSKDDMVLEEEVEDD